MFASIFIVHVHFHVGVAVDLFAPTAGSIEKIRQTGTLLKRNFKRMPTETEIKPSF
jgi:hypothetical protein